MNNVPHINQQRGVIAWFAQNPVAANLLMIFILALGLMQMGNLRKESFPSVEPSKITVAISYDSGSAQQAEEGLAIKIEDSLESISGIKNITSTSTSSGTRVQIEKTSTADLQNLLNDVTAEVDAISSFPSGADNPVISKATRQDHALQIAIYGDTDRKTLQDLQEELKQDLLRQSAISEVVTLGERDPKISIELDEAKLQAYGLTFSDISTVINAESANSVGGEIRGENRTFSIEASAQAYRYQDFANIVLKTSANGGQLLLSDVATVRDTYEDNSSAATRFQGQPAMSIQMVMNDDSDITDVVTQANNVVEKWQSNGNLC
jgi:multidrug efflux pump subunit AcrB